MINMKWDMTLKGKRITFDSNNRLVHIVYKGKTLFVDKHWIERTTI
jgi:hypothetical protein